MVSDRASSVPGAEWAIWREFASSQEAARGTARTAAGWIWSVMLRMDITRIVRWLASALGLAGRYQHEELVPTALWRLGEIEHRRKRRIIFFGRRLNDPP